MPAIVPAIGGGAVVRGGSQGVGSAAGSGSAGGAGGGAGGVAGSGGGVEISIGGGESDLLANDFMDMKQIETKSGAEGGGAPLVFWESRVAKALGLSRERVRALREAHLSAGEWEVRGNAIVLSASGLEKITFYAAQAGGEVSSPSAEQTGAAVEAGGAVAVVCGAPEVVQAVIKRVCPNRRMMLAIRVGSPEGEDSLLVRVKDNVNFMAGMVVEVMDCGNGVWQYRGRMPRSRGRF